MPTLRFPLANGGERVVELPVDTEATIGRDDNNTLTLEHDTVSRRHARLTWTANGACRLENLSSANGTAVNGLPVLRPEILQDGDRLSFGEFTVTFLAAEADADRLPPPRHVSGEVFAARYRLKNSVGETTEYHNFRAVDLAANDRPVSLKILRPAVVTQAGGSGHILQTCAQIRAAPVRAQWVRLLDFGRWRGVVFLASEWVEGRPLVDVLRRRGALGVPETVQLARQAAAATDHARAHRLPPPELALRSVLVAFHAPLSAADWETLLDAPVERWPAFTLKFNLRLTAPASAPSALVGFVYELLGHPAAALGAPRPTRVASLGERGNAVLTRAQGSSATGGAAAFESDTVFIDTLGQAVGMASDLGAPVSAGVTTVEPPAEVLARAGQIAERAHELWVAGRRRDGWRYGAERDDRAKQHPRMVTYAELSDDEKRIAQDHVLHTLRAVTHLGCQIAPASETCTREDSNFKPSDP